jgi:quercetin dioxygenase-like cupin family protein
MATAPKSEILKVAGSIVSRQITKADAGNVTLFAFDKDQELSEHTAPFDALVHILDGSAEINISGTAFELGTGDAIIMPANEPHALKAISPFKMLLTMIRS